MGILIKLHERDPHVEFIAFGRSRFRVKLVPDTNHESVVVPSDVEHYAVIS
ncbi:MAG: hypothetical protein ACYC33_09405 [Thermoleophilia bacterium]